MYNDVANRYSEEYKNSENFKSDIEEEMIADYLGENLSTEEFMTRLEEAQKTKNQSKIKQVIDNFIQKIKDFFTSRIGTGIKEKNAENYYWNKIENLFYDAYLNTENVGTSKYSIQIDSNGNKYVKVDTDQDIFEGIAKKDYNKIAKMYMQDYLMGETTLANTDVAKIDNRSANKYTNPGKRQQYFKEKMQLTPELKNVLEIAQKETQALPSKENSKYSSWEYYKFNFELSGRTFEGVINIGIDTQGNKHFYEINKIKETVDILGTSLNNRSTASSINNSIPQSKEKGNTNIKYSMQENKNNTENSNKSSFSLQEINSKITSKGNINKLTKNGITMTYVHINNENSVNYGNTYGQNIEPVGEYMSMDTLQGTSKIPNADYGRIHFDNPLILDHINTSSTGWKKTLSEMFDNKIGKELSNAIKSAGYDAIITIDENGNYSEIVNINGNKLVDNQNSNKSSFSLPKNHKQQQLEIIQKFNPMLDDYHTGIRTIEDIKTLSETLQDSDYEGYDEFNPDLTRKMIEEAIESGEITVYSSNEIKQGTFVSPSRMEAESYSGNGKIYEKKVKIEDIAWIDVTQGQYAKIDNKTPTVDTDIRYSQDTSGEWNTYLQDTTRNTETRKAIEDLKQNYTKKYSVENNNTKNSLPVSESAYQDIVNNAKFIPNEEKANLIKELEGVEKSPSSLKDFEKLVKDMDNTYKSIDDEILTPKTYNTGNKKSIIENEAERIRKDSEKFAKQVDEYVSGTLKSSDYLNLGSTPQILQDIGVPDYAISMKQSKLKSIMTETDNWNDRNHGLTVEIIKQLPKAIANPLDILKSSTKDNSIVIITDLADKLDRPIIASIEISKAGQIGNLEFMSNRLTSAYGKNNYDRFMQTEIEKGNLLYDIDEGIIKELPTSTRLQLSEGLNSSVDTVDNVSTSNNIISQNKEDMQENLRKDVDSSIEDDLEAFRKATDELYLPTKPRSYPKTVLASDYVSTEVKAQAKKVLKDEQYVPIPNTKTIDRATKNINKVGVDSVYTSFNKKFESNDNMALDDIAEAELLIQHYSNVGDLKKAKKLIAEVAIVGTELGQKVQALSIISYNSLLYFDMI